MDLQVFRDFASQNYEEHEAARNILLEHVEGNPNFLFELLNLISQPEISNDEKLSMPIVIVLVHTHKTTWGTVFDQNAQINIANQILEIIFNTSFTIQSQLIECLRTFIETKGFDSTPIYQAAMNQLQIQGNSQENTNIAFQILQVFSAMYCNESSNDDTFINNMSLEIFPIINQYIGSFDETWLNSSLMQSSIMYSAIIMKNCMKSCSTALGLPEFLNVYPQYAEILCINSLEESIIKIKGKISQFFSKSILSITTRKYRPSRNPYVDSFQNQIIPIIVQVIPKCFETLNRQRSNLIDRVIVHLLLIASTCIKRNLFMEYFGSIEFIEGILIPATYLTESDLESFESVPESYIELCLSNEASTPYMVRNCCARVAFNMRQNPIFLQQIQSFSGDRLDDLESRLFLMSIAYQKQRISSDLYQQVLNFLQIQCPPYVIATILRVLQNKRMPAADIRDVAFNLIAMSQEVYVVQIEAINLLNSAIKKCHDLGTIDPHELILHLVQITNPTDVAMYVPDIAIGDLLTTLAVECPEQFIRDSKYVIECLFQEWFTLYERTIDQEISEETSDVISERISTVKIIIQSITDQNLINDILLPVLSFVSRSIEQYPENDSMPDIVKMCSTYICKISVFPEEIFQLIPLLQSFLETNEENVYLFADIAGIYCTLIPYIPVDHQYLNLIIECCEAATEQLEEETTGAALVTLSVIIQAHGQAYFERIIPKANYIFQNAEQLTLQIIMGAVYIYASALYVTKGEAISVLDESSIMTWLQYVNTDTFNHIRDASVCTIGLLYVLSRKNDSTLIPIINELVTYITHRQHKQLRNGQNALTEEEDMFMEEEMFIEEEDNDVFVNELPIIPDETKIPTDSVSLIQLYSEIYQQLGLASEIPEELFPYINNQA